MSLRATRPPPARRPPAASGPALSRAPGPRSGRSQRGAALLVVITSIAVLTALVVDLAYNTRVSTQIAANARGELQAECAAKSAVAFSRLVLHFQQQLDQASGAAASFAARLGTQLPQAGFRLWDIVPVDSAALSALVPSAGTAAGEASFQARIEDEDRKVNVSQLAGIGTAPGAQLMRYAELVKDPRYDFLFDRDDAYGNRFTRAEVAINMKDWVDEDEVTSALTANPAAPFENAFGDENYPYDKGPDRYRAKNARFDSLDELHLVGGVSDAFLAAFGDRLTVYPDVNAPINVNTSDPQEMMINILVMSQPPGIPQPPLLDPAFPQRLEAALQLARPLPFMSLSVRDFATIVTGLGIQVQPMYLQAVNADARVPYGNRSFTFTIHALGKAGEVEKALDVVVTFDDRAGALAGDQGRILHWREE